MKFLSLFLLSVFCSLVCFGQNITNMVASQRIWSAMPLTTTPSVGGGGCNTIKDSYLGNHAGTSYIGGGYLATACKFVASNSYTACSVSVVVERIGSGSTYTVHASIYSHDSGSNQPNVLIGTSSDEVALSSFNTSYGLVTFPNMSATLVSGTTYWIVLRITVADGSYTNYSQVDTRSFLGQTNGTMLSTNGTTWTVLGGQSSFQFNCYGP